MTDGCTALAKIVGNRYFLAKNRDLVVENIKNSVLFDDAVFLVRGFDVTTSKEIGASFGINRWGLSACNTTVLVTKEQPYDLLLERVLRETKTIEEAFTFIRADLKSGSRYQWSNFILATPSGVGVVEIGDGVAVLEQDYNMIVRTNHHLLLPTAEILRKASATERDAGGPLNTSQSRRQQAAKLIHDATSKMDIAQIMSAHTDDRGFSSICRHPLDTPNIEPYRGQTVFSYLAEVSSIGLDDFEFRISIAKGNPCSELYKEYQLDFDSPVEEKNLLVHSMP